MAKEIIITYNPDGTVKMEAEGFVETECLEGTAAYEKALGLNKTNSERKMKVATPRKEGIRHGIRNQLHIRR